MNSAMLGKIGWSLASTPNKLWVKALKAKYFPFSTLYALQKEDSLFSALAGSSQCAKRVDKKLMF